MALVTYSDSEGSDSDSAPKTAPASRKHPAPTSSKINIFQPLVDRSNPRKILVNLSNTETGDEARDAASEEGPARKRARIGGGNSFAGFNAMLPAPKRAAQDKDGKKVSSTAASRPVFSLKTSAAPGFVREPESGFLEDNQNGDTVENDSSGALPATKDEPVVVKKGNPMMFKPLSVAQNTKKKPKAPPQKSIGDVKGEVPVNKGSELQTAVKTEPVVSKPKVNLFGISSNEPAGPTAELIAQPSHYEPLIYAPSSGSTSLESQALPTKELSMHKDDRTSMPTHSNSLENIASDLNLSQSEIRQLMGRKGRTSAADAKILTFNTDEEYNSNSAYLASMSEQELAAQQHNPVRSIAPGKHSLQQLVNAVSNQRDALEDSFAAGKRNRKEAGSRYGW
ncbi:hypothetical protein DIZ76_015783 [Coccidioides immitis]|nr:hypothetical protein CIRG_05186 [Coccidioides immitis RMSCC 2394]TPX21819.1 hypothetical protein DIZ76_015783 [Coccidioides immitis]